MGQAGRADCILPAVPLKPGKCRGWFSLKGTSFCPLKTTQFKGDAGGVEKNVLMEPIF
jgi:hypothetical protein